MAAFEGSMKNMLQGVSQQLQRERQEGQVTLQENMLSDLVTGLRRRPGSEVINTFDYTNADKDKIVAWNSDVANRRINCVVNGVDGNLHLYQEDWTPITTLQNDYFIFESRTSIQHAVVRDQMFICNKEVIPQVKTYSTNTATKQGFFFIKTGAFQTAFALDITDTAGNHWTASYTTPAATEADASANSTPTYIATQLVTQLQAIVTPAGLTVYQIGAYVFVTGPSDGFAVTSSLSSSYLGVSGASHVQQISDLPARLPDNADGYIVAVGSSNMPSYYRWDKASTSWKEDAVGGSPTALQDMPQYLNLDQETEVWSLSDDYEGRFAGDDLSDPLPGFLNYGVDGIGSFQGRLVILNGSMVNLSAAGKPTRFFRSTVDNVIASDPIEVGASANSSAAYEYCVPFNKDLLLFSEKYQALIPGGAVITPQNTTVVVTSTYEADMTSYPLALGRTVMYPVPRSSDYFGMMEMLPSLYTNSQYVSSDVTAHLPKYMGGRCRFSVSSSVAGIACFASSLNYKQLIVHEYTWDGDTKAQQAWHSWTFPYDIADAFFYGSEIVLIFVNNGRMLAASVDPRVGTLTQDGDRRPFLDCYTTQTVTATALPIPEFFQDFDPLYYTVVRLADTSMDLLGEEVGIVTRATDSLVTVPSFDTGTVTMGIAFTSQLGPSMPTVKDNNGVVISSNKLTLLRFMIGTENSYEYEAIVHDSSDDAADSDEDLATLYWGSSDLELGSPRVATESVAILPCRTNAASTTVIFLSDGLGELNIVSLEYTCRYNQKLRRR